MSAIPVESAPPSIPTSEAAPVQPPHQNSIPHIPSSELTIATTPSTLSPSFSFSSSPIDIFQAESKSLGTVLIRSLPLASYGQSKRALHLQFVQEVQRLGGLRSPRLVPIVGYTEDTVNDRYYIVMEHHENLYDVLHAVPRGDITWDRRCRWGLQAALSLQAIQQHEGGCMLPLDIKSSSFMVDSQRDNILLWDYGFQEIRHTMAKLDVTIGLSHNTHPLALSLAWRSPESLSRKPSRTIETCIYSLGVVLWELSEHKRPFEEQVVNAVIPAIICSSDTSNREQFSGDVPPGYSRMVRQCWDMKPQDRIKLPLLIQYLERLANTKGTDLLEDDEKKEVVAPSISSPVSEPGAPPPVILKGTAVAASFNGGDVFPAKIEAYDSDKKTYHVIFDDGDLDKKVPELFVWALDRGGDAKLVERLDYNSMLFKFMGQIESYLRTASRSTYACHINQLRYQCSSGGEAFNLAKYLTDFFQSLDPHVYQASNLDTQMWLTNAALVQSPPSVSLIARCILQLERAISVQSMKEPEWWAEYRTYWECFCQHLINRDHFRMTLAEVKSSSESALKASKISQFDRSICPVGTPVYCQFYAGNWWGATISGYNPIHRQYSLRFDDGDSGTSEEIEVVPKTMMSTQHVGHTCWSRVNTQQAVDCEVVRSACLGLYTLLKTLWKIKPNKNQIESNDFDKTTGVDYSRVLTLLGDAIDEKSCFDQYFQSILPKWMDECKWVSNPPDNRRLVSHFLVLVNGLKSSITTTQSFIAWRKKYLEDMGTIMVLSLDIMHAGCTLQQKAAFWGSTTHSAAQ